MLLLSEFSEETAGAYTKFNETIDSALTQVEKTLLMADPGSQSKTFEKPWYIAREAFQEILRHDIFKPLTEIRTSDDPCFAALTSDRDAYIALKQSGPFMQDMRETFDASISLNNKKRLFDVCHTLMSTGDKIGISTTNFGTNRNMDYSLACLINPTISTLMKRNAHCLGRHIIDDLNETTVGYHMTFEAAACKGASDSFFMGVSHPDAFGFYVTPVAYCSVHKRTTLGSPEITIQFERNQKIKFFLGQDVFEDENLLDHEKVFVQEALTYFAMSADEKKEYTEHLNDNWCDNIAQIQRIATVCNENPDGSGQIVLYYKTSQQRQDLLHRLNR